MALEERLKDRIHKKDIDEIVQMANGDKRVIDTLLTLMDDSDKRVSNNALWCIQHLLPSDFKTHIVPRKDTLIDTLLKTDDASNRRMLLALLRDMDFDKDEIRTDLLDFSLENIVNLKWPVGTRALCIHLATKLCTFYPELCTELKTILGVMDNEGLQPGLASAKKNALKKLHRLEAV